ncbi:MAG: hypothetical protein ABIO82_03010, partial [Ginsengibacter sp.]
MKFKNLFRIKLLLPVVAAMLLMSSCVAKRYLTQSQMQTASLREDSTQMANKISSLESNIASLKNEIATLTNKVADLTNQNSKLSNQNSQLGQQTVSQQSQLSQSKETL